ncbi:MAG: sugar ABC transporter permease [Firmicutes bacterium]|nr:sugar ABC transporter permease [Bacillota bacterium]
MLIPMLAFYLIFKFYPATYLIIAFQDYWPTTGIAGSEWVGWANFQKIFKGTATFSFWQLFSNTLILAIYNLLFYFPIPIILALLLNEVRHLGYKKIVQSFVYLPHFLSWSVIIGLVYVFLGSNGYVNKLLTQAGRANIAPLMDPNWFRPLIVMEVIWKEAGWGTIIYLAALSGVDEQLYEAAVVDGANRWKQLLHITFPAIRGTIITLFILRMGTFMDTGFEQIFLMSNTKNRSLSQVFDTYIYDQGIKKAHYSFSTALGIFKSVISLILVITTNKIANWVGEEGVY